MTIRELLSKAKYDAVFRIIDHGAEYAETNWVEGTAEFLLCNLRDALLNETFAYFYADLDSVITICLEECRFIFDENPNLKVQGEEADVRI